MIYLLVAFLTLVWPLANAAILAPQENLRDSSFSESNIPALPTDFNFGSQQSINSLLKSAKLPTISANELRPQHTHASWSATIEPSVLSPGGSGKILLKAIVDQQYHLYPFRVGDLETQNRTLIVASQKSQLKLFAPETSTQVISKDLGGFLLEYYDGSVTWEIPFEVRLDTPNSEQSIELLVGFNTCNDTTCDPPAAIQFTGNIKVGANSGSSSIPMSATEIEIKTVEQSNVLASSFDARTSHFSIASRLAGEPLQLWMIFAAIAGGFILNFMPCVLPVVGLKLMSFVNQAGNSHARVIKLNLAFVSGILVVVLMLAGFNIFTKLAGQAMGWGEQFNSFPLQLLVVVLLFAMSLSFLGVWEIPIPGFATSSKAGELLQKDGTSGAFYKGILTTLLATPCSGPLLGAVFGETLKLSAIGSIVVFLCVGIGLGLPYLAMCLWPNSARMLPKPGPWMDTLKQVLAFPLLLSMIWFLNIIDPQYHIAVLVLLIFVWFSCWMVGQIPAYAERHTRFRIGVTAIAICIIAGTGSFKYFGPSQHLLPWQAYSEAALESHRSSGKPVLVEFTARWCPTCQTNMRFAIDRPEIAKLVDRHDVVTLLADWTDTSPNSASATAIRRKVHELESNSIPLLAIYPADPSAAPIVLRDIITQQQLIAAIQQAVDGKSVASQSAPVLR